MRITATRTPAALALALALGACDSSVSPNPYQTPAPAGGGTSITSGSNPTDGTTVTISILTPGEGDTLSSKGVADVRANIMVRAGQSSVGNTYLNPRSVEAVLRSKLPSGLPGEEVSQAPMVAMTETAYGGKLSLLSLPSGEYMLQVKAATPSGVTAQSQVSVKLDAGPVITVLSPAPGTHHKGILTAEVLVDASPYGLPMLPLEATVGGVPVVLDAVGTSNTFRGSLEFAKPNPPLVGPQLFIVAARNANGTRSESRVMFVVDELGPAITDTFPGPGAVVGGVVRISAHIADDADVLPPSVVVLIGNANDPKFKLTLKEEGKGVFSTLFDTAKLTGCRLPPDPGLCIVFPTLSFRAADLLGNETTVAYEIAVDNEPPLLDLDPPPVRDSHYDMGWRCSWEFDPLSNNALIGDMPGDGCMVSQLFDLRARIEDEGNFAGGLKKVPIAGIDPTTVSAFVLDDTTQPLVVDSNGDGVCDAINPKLIPTTSPPTRNTEVLKVRLAGVKPQGAADFRPDPSLVNSPICLPGMDTNPPPRLCTVSQPTIVIGYAGRSSAIWSVEPIDAGFCQGIQFDTLANNIGQGWACIAVAASDRNGNTSVSAPLRVWIDYGQNGPHCPAPPPTAGPAPDCTGRFDKPSGAVSAQACTSRRFEPGQICELGECGRARTAPRAQ